MKKMAIQTDIFKKSIVFLKKNMVETEQLKKQKEGGGKLRVIEVERNGWKQWRGDFKTSNKNSINRSRGDKEEMRASCQRLIAHSDDHVGV